MLRMKNSIAPKIENVCKVSQHLKRSIPTIFLQLVDTGRCLHTAILTKSLENSRSA